MPLRNIVFYNGEKAFTALVECDEHGATPEAVENARLMINKGHGTPCVSLKEACQTAREHSPPLVVRMDLRGA